METHLNKVVAVVGRPNVGKSTLFNRIIRRREAIVDDVAGITRDRKYADAEWEGVHFTLIDTGGYLHKADNPIDSGVANQVRLAMEEADLVLLVVDVTTGITDEDHVVAELLRKAEQKTILVVNKVDGQNREPLAAEFARLGIPDLVFLSALGGRNLGDCLSLVLDRLGRPPQAESEPADENEIKLAIVGRPNTGKSTFINSVLGRERMLVTDVPGTTRDAIDIRLETKGRVYRLVDTAGLRKKSHVDGIEFFSTIRTRKAIEDADVAAVFCDASEGFTQQDSHVLQEVLDLKKGALIVLNKWDLIKDNPDAKYKLADEIDLKMGGLRFVPQVHASALTRYRTGLILDLSAQIYSERRKRVSSPEFNEFLTRLNQRHQPPGVQGKKVRILYGIQARINPPVFALFSNHPNLIPDSHRRFIENQIREAFGFEGVPLTLVLKQK